MPWDKFNTRELRDCAGAVGEDWNAGRLQEALADLDRLAAQSNVVRAMITADLRRQQTFYRREPESRRSFDRR